MNSAARLTALVLLVGTAALTGCAGAAAPRAAAPPAQAPALTLAFTGAFADPQIAAFEEAIDESGAVGLEISDGYDTNVLGVEQTIVAAVAHGDLDLGLVGVRALGELGVHDFDALIAPMLIDGLELERAVLASDIPSRMLPALDALGVTGLAVVGGPIRRPIGIDPVLSLDDFTGIPFYSWHSELNAAAIGALGATNVDLAPPERNAGIEDGSIRAYENTLAYLADAVDRRARTMTGNIDLWPSVGVLIVNPDVLASLTADQRRALTDAAAQTAASAIDSLDDETALAALVCAAGGRIVLTTDEELAAIREALEPVYRHLASDPSSAAYLDEIADLKGLARPDALTIPNGC